jgi:hypothetical protein
MAIESAATNRTAILQDKKNLLERSDQKTTAFLKINMCMK